jgi:hypothetical protein
VAKYVMSVTHLQFGASAVNLRPNLFSAGYFVGSACVVVEIISKPTQQPSNRRA